MLKIVMSTTINQTEESSLQVPRFPLVKYIVDQIISSKSYDGIVAKYVAIKKSI